LHGIRQQLSFYSPNITDDNILPNLNNKKSALHKTNPIDDYNNSNNNSVNLKIKTRIGNNDSGVNSSKKKINESLNNFDIDQFFKSINNDNNDGQSTFYTNTSNISNRNTYYTKQDFKKLIFDEDDSGRENNENSEDQYNFPFPHESTKYSHIAPEYDNCPLEIDIEGGLSCIPNKGCKTNEMPVEIEIKVRPEILQKMNINYNKDLVIIFNSHGKY
jgi:hypothetical protein